VKILTIKNVCDITSMSRATVYRLISAGEFPSKVQLSPRRVGWREAEVLNWIACLTRVRILNMIKSGDLPKSYLLIVRQKELSKLAR